MREKITASEGHILTDGKAYGTQIYPGEGVDIGSFYEITQEEYNKRMEMCIPEGDTEGGMT